MSVGPRSDYLSWDGYFMALAELSAQRSKDPVTKVGAVIVDRDERVVGVGYNGFPTGCSDESLPWCRSPRETPSTLVYADPWLNTKYPYVCHAAINAILNSQHGGKLEGCRMYTTLLPNDEGCKTIVQSGICELIYAGDPYSERSEWKAGKRMLSLAGVRTRKYGAKYPDRSTNYWKLFIKGAILGAISTSLMNRQWSV